MNAIDFPGSNVNLGRPRSMTDEQCGSLPVYTDGQTCLSEWELTAEEMAWIVRTKRVRLWVWSGRTQPPVSLVVVSPNNPKTAEPNPC
jgi:hypothetical protein